VTPPLLGANREEFLRGVELFNTGRYWDAHEAWEAVWNATAGEERLFYQGLIQAAAAMVHRQKSNPHGIAELSRKSLQKLERFGPLHRAVDLARFRADLLAAVSAAAGGEWPRIELVGEP
jgi:predicted metal-dependent hydrolase